MKKIIGDADLNELKDIVESYGEKSFRATQLFRNFQSGKPISEMTDLSKAFRDKLTEDYEDAALKIIEIKKSATDGTEKFLFGLSDGNVIEGVLMKYKYGNTQCVSTQVGCRMGCAFCASGIGGLVRNLTAGEILAQVAAVNAYAGGTLEKRKVTNVVLMGSGEPLDNYDNTIKFIRNVSCDKGLGMSPRNISLSTCGLVPKMYELAEEGLDVNLTVSLHNPFDDGRRELMPVANKYKISEILAACENYFDKTGRRYIFEYSLVRGKNDTEAHAAELIRLLRGKPCHVNIIRLNEVKEKNLVSTDDKAAYAFADKLVRGGLSASVRRRLGADIDGACGQLRRNYLEKQ